MTKFITNQNIEIQLELASLGDRIVAFLIDALIMGAYAIFMSIIVGIAKIGTIAFIFYIPLMFYSITFEIFMNGQSPGKSAKEIKVVKLNGGAPTIGSYLLRWLFRPLDIILYGAVAMVSIIVSKNGQRVGDMAAGTTVIKIKNRTSLKEIKTVPREDGYVIQFPEVKRLNDKQMELIKQSLKMGDDGLNYQAISQLTEKIKTSLQIKSELPDVKFLYTILADYEHLDR